MRAADIFQIANAVALIGWLVLIAGVIMNKPLLRDQWAGRWWPIGLSAVYSVLIIFFFLQAPGGFDSLANVQLLFTSEWAALAGWIHYLAFDLFIGAWISKRVTEEGLSRVLLLPLLPLTFMFGPMGLLGFEITRQLLRRETSTTNY